MAENQPKGSAKPVSPDYKKLVGCVVETLINHSGQPGAELRGKVNNAKNMDLDVKRRDGTEVSGIVDDDEKNGLRYAINSSTQYLTGGSGGSVVNGKLVSDGIHGNSVNNGSVRTDTEVLVPAQSDTVPTGEVRKMTAEIKGCVESKPVVSRLKPPKP